MNGLQAGAVGGLAGGLAMSVAMIVGRRSGLLHKTLAEDAEDWLDRIIEARRHLGHSGTTALEQANHMAVSAGCGAGYGILGGRLPRIPALALGALYGARLYAINIAGTALLLGITEGERKASAPLRAERLGLHLLYGALTAVVADHLNKRCSAGQKSLPSQAFGDSPFRSAAALPSAVPC